MNMKIRANNQSEYNVETLQNGNWRVPVAMMLEGVHNGSAGPILHLSDELSANVESWNGIPVTIQHPQDGTGQYISANSPGVVSIGHIESTYFDGKLRAFAVIEPNVLLVQSPAAHQAILNGQPIDVSVGVFSSDLAIQGEHNGEQYEAVATNYIPDHLAFLPGGTGACSWNDGCGIRNNENQKRKNNMTQIETKPDYLDNITLHVNGDGYQERLDRAYSMVNSMDSDAYWYYMEEMYDDYIIYRRRNRQTSESVYFKQMYTMNDDGLQFDGDPIRVKKELEYVEIQANETKLNNNKEETEMENTEKTEITANDVREFLNGKTQSEIIELMPESIRANIESGLNVMSEKRNATIDKIIANTGETWKKEELTAMSCDQLSKLESMISTDVDYSGASGSNVQANENDDVAPMVPGIVEEKE